MKKIKKSTHNQLRERQHLLSCKNLKSKCTPLVAVVYIVAVTTAIGDHRLCSLHFNSHYQISRLIESTNSSFCAFALSSQDHGPSCQIPRPAKERRRHQQQQCNDFLSIRQVPSLSATGRQEQSVGVQCIARQRGASVSNSGATIVVGVLFVGN